MIERVLILSNSADTTTDYLLGRLEFSNIPSIRYNTDTDFCSTRFSYRENRPIISWKEHNIDPEQIVAIILRRPKPLKPLLEDEPFDSQHAAQEWAEAWEGFLAHLPDIRWINHPAHNFRASHKIEQLSRAKKFGLQVPVTVVTNDPEEARLFVEQQTVGTIIKPLASGYIERSIPSEDTVIYTNEFRQEHRNRSAGAPI